MPAQPVLEFVGLSGAQRVLPGRARLLPVLGMERAAGLVAEKLETTATVTFEKLEVGWTVTGILLDVKGTVPKADQAAWEKATQAAKAGCPISRLLNTTITMQAKLEG